MPLCRHPTEQLGERLLHHQVVGGGVGAGVASRRTGANASPVSSSQVRSLKCRSCSTTPVPQQDQEPEQDRHLGVQDRVGPARPGDDRITGVSCSSVSEHHRDGLRLRVAEKLLDALLATDSGTLPTSVRETLEVRASTDDPDEPLPALALRGVRS